MKIYLCRECGHVQEGPHGVVRGNNEYRDRCESCSCIDAMDLYVKTERPDMRARCWADLLAIKRAEKGKKS